MRQTSSYTTANNYTPAAVVPFFRSRWGLLSLLAIGSGLYLYQRRGGSISGLFNKLWSAGMSARSKISEIAPSVSSSTGDVKSYNSSVSSRQSSPTAGI